MNLFWLFLPPFAMPVSLPERSVKNRTILSDSPNTLVERMIAWSLWRAMSVLPLPYCSSISLLARLEDKEAVGQGFVDLYGRELDHVDVARDLDDLHPPDDEPAVHPDAGRLQGAFLLRDKLAAPPCPPAWSTLTSVKSSSSRVTSSTRSRKLPSIFPLSTFSLSRQACLPPPATWRRRRRERPFPSGPYISRGTPSTACRRNLPSISRSRLRADMVIFWWKWASTVSIPP